MELSIIIPVYNVVQYLPHCLDSILPQIGQDDEVLLIDDGSTDGSELICDEYARRDGRVRVFHQKNKGASAARNVGLDYSKGEWIVFVDSDDWVTSDYISILKTKGIKADITFFPFTEITQSGSIRIRHLKNAYADSRKDIEKILYDLKYGVFGDIFGWTCGKLIRASIIRDNNIRFVEGLVFREDEIFTMDVCRFVQSVQVLDHPIYNYRILSTGLTAKGILPTDYLQLANSIERNLPYFTYSDFLRQERHRVADYHLDYFRKTVHIRNLHRTMRKSRKFFREKPEYIQEASNVRFAAMLSHSYLYSYCLLMVNFLLEAVLGRIR